MSIKLRLANLYDRLALTGLIGAVPFSSISLTPVFHVEKLYVDHFFSELDQFLCEYRELTGVRAVITCMTPCSPILNMQLRQTGFDIERYWDRIRQLSKKGIVGLHGHYVRAIDNRRVLPMHFSFRDNSLIERQLVTELEALRERMLVDDDLLIYSGGWWFTSLELRKLLLRIGFKWDYTISSSLFNISPGSRALSTSIVDGVRQQTIEGKSLKSAVAVSGITKVGRPYHSIAKILNECRDYPPGPVSVSLYSHDYDLDSNCALAMVRRYLRAGLFFSEPS